MSADEPFLPGREARWRYAHQTIAAVEGWNCVKGRGCIHGAGKGDPEWQEFGPGGTCGLLASIFVSLPIPEMDDDGERVTCTSYEERPAPAALSAHTTEGDPT